MPEPVHGTSGGVKLTEERVGDLADEAERGYDAKHLREREHMTLEKLIGELVHWLDEPHNLDRQTPVQLNGVPVKRVNYRPQAGAIEIFSGYGDDDG